MVTLSAERNLNPKAACLKRREEEKADEYSASHNVVAPSEAVLHSSVVCVTTDDVCLLFIAHVTAPPPLTSTWPHLRCDVGLEEEKY